MLKQTQRCSKVNIKILGFESQQLEVGIKKAGSAFVWSNDKRFRKIKLGQVINFSFLTLRNMNDINQFLAWHNKSHTHTNQKRSTL